MRFLIVGAGLSGAVYARFLAEAGHHCDIYEQADHVAGHCHTARHPQTGIMMHHYGPHTLHTDNVAVWSFLEKFAEIYPYRHRKQAWAKGRLYPFPINLPAINQFFSTDLSTDEVNTFLKAQTMPLEQPPQNFEEAALSTIGPLLYEAFYEGYTAKQWGRAPETLPPFVFKRLPVHLTDDQNVFHHARQGQPVGGYTHMVEQIVNHPAISVFLKRPFEGKFEKGDHDHLIYTGPIDRYFNWGCGRLAYRTIDFQHEQRGGTFQECGTVNYCDYDVPYTRIAEHKHFWPFEPHQDTVITYEFSRECEPKDEPFYPIRLNEANQIYKDYVNRARQEEHVSFIGRLGTYRYLDMDAAIREAMHAATETITAINENRPIPPFFVDTKSDHS